jgi:hypothetical protein
MVLGAWCVIEGKKFQPWVTSRTALVLAVLYLAFSLIIALSWRITPLESLVPRTLTSLLLPLDKSNLSPLRLLHFIALAILAVWCVPHNWRGLMTPLMRGAMRCGQNSLPIYCLGVLLALASQMALLDVSNGLAMQIALSFGGILAMIVAAMLLNSIRIKPRQRFRRDSTLERDDFGLARSLKFEGIFFGREGSENCASPQVGGDLVAAVSESHDAPNSQRPQLVRAAF